MKTLVNKIRFIFPLALLPIISMSAGAHELKKAVSVDESPWVHHLQDSIFTREQVSEHVWVIFGRGGNIGVIVTEEGVLLIDTQFKNIAPGIVNQVKQITDKPIRYIINTHVHGDHVGGNPVLQEYGDIIAQRNTFERMKQKENIKGVPERSKGLPQIVFEKELRFYLGGMEIRALHFGRGHTDTDVVVWVPSEKVLHAGDLLFNEIIPFVDLKNGAHTGGWTETLMRLYQMLPEDAKVIAGHGKTTDREGLRKMANYFRTVRQAVVKAHQQGKSKDEILAMTFPEFADWPGQRRLNLTIDAIYTEMFGNGSTLLIVNKSENTVAFYDILKDDIRGKVPTGPNPHEIAVTPDGKWAYVTNYGSGRPVGRRCWLTVIDVEKMEAVRDLELIDPATGAYLSAPHGIMITPDGRWMWVTAEGSQAVARIRLPEEKIEAVYKTGQRVSHQVAPLPDGSKAYVANIGSGSVSVVDVASGRVKTIPTARGTEGIAVTPDGKKVWATNREANSISVINTKTDQVDTTLSAGNFPIRVKFTPDGRYALVSNANDGSVAVYNTATYKIERVIETGAMPVGLLIMPDGKKAFVANTRSDRVSILNLESWIVEDMISPGKEPDGLGLAIEMR